MDEKKPNDGKYIGKRRTETPSLMIDRVDKSTISVKQMAGLFHRSDFFNNIT